MPSHAALTSTGAQGFGLGGRGVGGQGMEVGQAWRFKVGGGEDAATLRILVGLPQPSGHHPLPAP